MSSLYIGVTLTDTNQEQMYIKLHRYMLKGSKLQNHHVLIFFSVINLNLLTSASEMHFGQF